MTPERMLTEIYSKQKQTSRRRGHPPPAYSKEELADWMDAQPNLRSLWAAYEASGYQTDLKPSVDRKDDLKPYTLDNIQLMTWGENNQKQRDNRRTGVDMRINRAVGAYTPDGALVRRFVSVNEAKREWGCRSFGIYAVANGVQLKDGRGLPYMPRSYKGYVWKWE